MFAEGETVILFPTPTLVPPHDPVNHCAVAPVPADPPFKVKVVESPKQMDVIPVILVGVTEIALTVTVAEAQTVVLQDPLYLTKYVVVVEGETVMLLPVPTLVPPQEPVNHCTVAPIPMLPPFTVSVVEFPLQMVVVPLILVGAIDVVQACLKASKIPPFLSANESVAVPFPVGPTVGFKAHDAPADD